MCNSAFILFAILFAISNDACGTTIIDSTGEELRVKHTTAVEGLTVPLGQTLELTAAQTMDVDSVDYWGCLRITKSHIGNNPGAVGLTYQFGGGYFALTPEPVQTSVRHVPSFHYYVPDYQGNVRLVVDGNGTIEQRNDYYAYGGPWGDNAASQGVQPNKYNGKELDRMHGLDWYDYGARMYDPAMGLFTQIDPLAEQYPHLNPYQYCAGNPVKYVDPDGMSPIYDERGNFLGTDDAGIAGQYYVLYKKHFQQGMPHYLVGEKALMKVSNDVTKRIESHFSTLSSRPDYDGFVTIGEGIAWAKAHPYALQHPTPDNTLYIDASQLDFGSISISDFEKVGVSKPQNLFVESNIVSSFSNPTLLATVYALGRVKMILTDRNNGSVKIVNDEATDYDWNLGGGTKRNRFIKANNFLFNINPNKHGFKTYYYGIGHLNQ